MARNKRATVRSRYDSWLVGHPLMADVIVGTSIALAVVALFLFVTFSGFGSSAEFIYSQF